MKPDINQIKLDAVRNQVQITFFKPDGSLVASCHTLVRVKSDEPVYDQFAFLESLQDALRNLGPDDHFEFPDVEWEEGARGLFHVSFKYYEQDDEALVQWTLVDKTEQYDHLLQLQQGRNDNAIAEEFALIQKKVAEVKRELLEYRNEELERIQAFKTDFFASVSHEMRTPLNSITGLVALLERDNTRLSEYLPALQATSNHLRAIINDILDLSKIEAGKLQFESIDFDLLNTCQNILKGLEHAAIQKGFELKASLPSMPLLVKADPTRLVQVLYNLLGNSLKFTKQGAVTLSVEEKGTQNGYRSVLFSVKDTGIGMDNEQVNKVLKPYEQADESTGRLYGGTGLGLHVTQKLVEAMGGELKIESEKGKGTTISFELQLEASDSVPEESAAESTQVLSGKRVLIAEDDELGRQVLRKLLNKFGAEVVPVIDGLELERKLSHENFDLVITDINIPHKTGVEVFRELRSKHNYTPFLFVSGNKPDAAYFDTVTGWDFLVKPIEPQELNYKIEKLIAKIFPTELNLDSLTEMVAGDESFLQDLLQTILDTLPEEMERLSNAIKVNDAVLAGKVLHKIRPSIDYMGVPGLSEERRFLHDKTSAGELDMEFTARSEDFDAWVRQALTKLQGLIK